jgi:hypothetical protein
MTPPAANCFSLGVEAMDDQDAKLIAVHCLRAAQVAAVR